MATAFSRPPGGCPAGNRRPSPALGSTSTPPASPELCPGIAWAPAGVQAPSTSRLRAARRWPAPRAWAKACRAHRSRRAGAGRQPWRRASPTLVLSLAHRAPALVPHATAANGVPDTVVAAARLRAPLLAVACWVVPEAAGPAVHLLAATLQPIHRRHRRSISCRPSTGSHRPVGHSGTPGNALGPRASATNWPPAVCQPAGWTCAGTCAPRPHLWRGVFRRGTAVLLCRRGGVAQRLCHPWPSFRAARHGALAGRAASAV